MNTRTTATLFSGFEGVGVGARNAGLTHLWGVEYDAAIASVAETNGFRTIVADVRSVDYAALERPWHLHASPVCKNASVAKSDGEESAEDIATAAAVERAIEALRPTLFTLENVRGYLHFAAFKNIVATLKRLGYTATHDVLNSANYGVPQTRERLILVARNDGRKPKLPAHTHARADKLGTLFDERKAWVGWYEAIEDLIPTLPDAVFAKWQLARMPNELRESVMPLLLNADAKTEPRLNHEPSFTILSTASKQMPKAWLVGSENAGQEWGGTRYGDEPAITLSTKTQPRAFIVDGQPAYGSDDTATRADGEYGFTIGATQDRRPLRAFITSDSRGGVGGDTLTMRNDDEPMSTLTTVNATHAVRASVNGRVVKMTPRCLARFQSFPDSYVLPTSAKLATTGIGNAVPPLLMQRVLEVNL